MGNLTNEDKCVMCGRYVPEGRQVCSSCEEKGYINQFNKLGESDIKISKDRMTKNISTEKALKNAVPFFSEEI